MKSGIYKITNKMNSKFYIGSSNNIKRRWRHHRSSLKRGTHSNVHLQRAYDKHGLSAFTFEVIREVEGSSLLREEQKMLDTLKPFGEVGYNISDTAGSPMLGKNHTEEVKQLLSDKLSGENHPHFGKPVSEEWRRKISKANKRFTDEEERSFRIRVEDGETIYKIAKELGIHSTTIKRAIQRSERFDY